MNSKNREDAVIPGNVLNSVVHNGGKRTSFLSLIEPLTDQPQNLLSTIKKQNENLMSGKNFKQTTLQETELVNTPRKKTKLTRV